MASIVGVQSAEVVLTCGELEETVAFFTARLGFRLDTIMPADDPDLALLSGHGLRLRLLRGDDGAPARLRLTCDDPDAGPLVAPNGTVIELAEAVRALVVPALAPVFELTRASLGDPAVPGRAGMRYRDLLPSRQGGGGSSRSHIAVPDGGPVPDYVHHHDIRVQIIYCHRGWVRVVYEDQGPPFVLEAGDCVLQPPGIRHRVLESSAGLEVVEVTCPAAHPTHADHDMTLPTSAVPPERLFGGQRSVRHGVAMRCGSRGGPATSTPATPASARPPAGSPVSASCGRRPAAPPRLVSSRCRADVLVRDRWRGHVEGRRTGSRSAGTGNAVAVPANLDHALTGCSDDLELLEVTLPDRPAVNLR